MMIVMMVVIEMLSKSMILRVDCDDDVDDGKGDDADGDGDREMVVAMAMMIHTNRIMSARQGQPMLIAKIGRDEDVEEYSHDKGCDGSL